MGTFITTEHEGAVALVTIDNPPMNALSAALVAELEDEVDRLDGDPDTRAVVLRGAGERAFVAGADIKEFPALRESGGGEGGAARGLHALGHRMDAARIPFVAAIQGFCLGGGLELAMCCDVRICAQDAKLGQPEIKLGLIPGGGGTQRLPRLVGIGRANLLNLGGEFIDADTAYAWGLVERVVSARRADSGGNGDRRGLRRAISARRRDRPGARPNDARPLARGGPATGGGRVPPLSSERGRERGRGGVRREARAHVHEPLMKAVVLEGIGGPEELVLRDVPAPVAAAGQSIVDVRASAINFLEVLVRRGLYPQMPDLPWVPGTEVAGTTEDGRRVLGLGRSTGGGYAEQVALDDQWTFDLPDGASFEEGASFLMAYLTAWIPLTHADRASARTPVFSSTLQREGSGARPSSRPDIWAPRSSRPSARSPRRSCPSRSEPSRR